MTVDVAPGHIALLLQHLQDGGVERCFLNLARGFAGRAVASDLFVHRVIAEGLLESSPGAPIAQLSGQSVAARAEQLAQEFQTRRTRVVLSAKEEDFDLVDAARRQMERPPLSVMVASLDYSGQLAGRRAGAWRRWRRYREIRRRFGAADRVFCVSEGVAQDMAYILRRPIGEFSVVPNPVVTPELDGLSRVPLEHPWFEPGQPPVVLGVGRLSRIKNFSLLLRAFAEARHGASMRLMILGDGKQRQDLQRLAERLGIADDVELRGFEANPYPYMRAAALFALSSAWEGFGNVLVEAMACGTPAVATDCPSGPRQILQDGRFGALVPIDDVGALAQAIIRSLQDPLPTTQLAEAVAPYTLENSVTAYLRALDCALPPADRAASHQL